MERFLYKNRQNRQICRKVKCPFVLHLRAFLTMAVLAHFWCILRVLFDLSLTLLLSLQAITWASNTTVWTPSWAVRVAFVAVRIGTGVWCANRSLARRVYSLTSSAPAQCSSSINGWAKAKSFVYSTSPIKSQTLDLAATELSTKERLAIAGAPRSAKETIPVAILSLAGLNVRPNVLVDLVAISAR